MPESLNKNLALKIDFVSKEDQFTETIIDQAEETTMYSEKPIDFSDKSISLPMGESFSSNQNDCYITHKLSCDLNVIIETDEKITQKEKETDINFSCEKNLIKKEVVNTKDENENKLKKNLIRIKMENDMKSVKNLTDELILLKRRDSIGTKDLSMIELNNEIQEFNLKFFNQNDSLENEYENLRKQSYEKYSRKNSDDSSLMRTIEMLDKKISELFTEIESSKRETTELSNTYNSEKENFLYNITSLKTEYNTQLLLKETDIIENLEYVNNTIGKKLEGEIRRF